MPLFLPAQAFLSPEPVFGLLIPTIGIGHLSVFQVSPPIPLLDDDPDLTTTRVVVPTGLKTRADLMNVRPHKILVACPSSFPGPLVGELPFVVTAGVVRVRSSAPLDPGVNHDRLAAPVLLGTNPELGFAAWHHLWCVGGTDTLNWRRHQTVRKNCHCTRTACQRQRNQDNKKTCDHGGLLSNSSTRHGYFSP